MSPEPDRLEALFLANLGAIERIIGTLAWRHGLTGDRAEDFASWARLRLMEDFKRYFENPEVSVSLKEMHSFKVSVQGNVRMPGQYEVRSQQTVLDLISRAQGFNEFADKGSIRVLRRANGREEAIRFRYNDAIDAKNGANFAVQPGDISVVD